jgi:hypothetical protein
MPGSGYRELARWMSVLFKTAREPAAVSSGHG